MLTGITTPSSGATRVLKCNTATQLSDVYHKIGFCPQFDSNLPLLTGRETLKYYAEIKGVHPADVDQVVQSLITSCDLVEYADRNANFYSGGK